MRARQIKQIMLLVVGFLLVGCLESFSSWAEELTVKEFKVGKYSVTQGAIATFPNFNYQGEVDDAGQAEGYGRGEFRQGEYQGLYFGQFHQGKRHGKGQFIAKDLVYVGDWLNGSPRGEGLILFANGDIYSGSHEAFVPNGWNGGMLYADGSRYLGPWSKGKYSSWGTLITTDGKAVSAWRFNGAADALARKEEKNVPALSFPLSVVNYTLNDRAAEWSYYSFLNDRAKTLGEIKTRLEKMQASGDLKSPKGVTEYNELGLKLLQLRHELQQSQIIVPSTASLTIDRHTQWVRYRSMMLLSADRVFAFWVASAPNLGQTAVDFTVAEILRSQNIVDASGLIFVGE